jgi:hypothetical protein
MLSLGKGDALVVSCKLSIGIWAPEGKEPRPSLRVLVHRVLTPYSVQRRRAAAGGGARRVPGDGMEVVGQLWGGEPNQAGRNHDAKGW